MEKEYRFKKPKTRAILRDNSLTLIRGDHDLMINPGMRGETVVLFKSVTEIKFQKPKLGSQGYLQLSTPRTGILGAARKVDQPQNAIKFNKDELEDVLEIKRYAESKIL